MARSLIDYLLNPFINIYFFFLENEFFDYLAYFIVTEFICLVMSFSGCVFNEYIILYFCCLERETQDEIAYRALHSRTVSESELDEINKKEKDKNDEEDEDDDNEDDNDEKRINKKSTGIIINIDGYSVDLK